LYLFSDACKEKEDITLMQHFYMIVRLKKIAVEHTFLPETRVIFPLKEEEEET
jgi:hypothetical protein